MEISLERVEAVDGLGVAVTDRGDTFEWSVTNDRATPVAVDALRLVFRLSPAPSRAFLNGWQSWSPSGGGKLSDLEDPSRQPGSNSFLRAMYHADDAVAAEGEVRSELVVGLAHHEDAGWLGFDGGDRHDGTFRVAGDTLRAEASLGGAVLQPGETRRLHSVRRWTGSQEAVPTHAEAWADWAGGTSGARRAAPFISGWCSWYQYFHAIDEAGLWSNLERARDLPLDVFQLDDGYQSAIGDWTVPNRKFPTPLDGIAARIAHAGLVPGIWLAPFLAAPGSSVAAAHPDWLARRRTDVALVGMANPEWGGTQHVLDTSHPAVLDHLEQTAAELVAAGFRYLKLDFTYAPAFRGIWFDPTLTPAQRVRAGYDAIRRGAGDDVYLLGCGAPLGPCIGVVDGMRIGPDVAPAWAPKEAGRAYSDAAPALVNAWRNTCTRGFMHRRLWSNDPDCVLVRATDIELTPAQRAVWTSLVAASGGTTVVSDDLTALDAAAVRALTSAVETARRADEEAMKGENSRCPDLLRRWTPAGMTGPVASATLPADPW